MESQVAEPETSSGPAEPERVHDSTTKSTFLLPPDESQSVVSIVTAIRAETSASIHSLPFPVINPSRETGAGGS